jgi:8-oxo-dGTP diphosphatase
MTTVVAAILVRDGRVLICQRARGQGHQWKWEFPGGKVEPNESLDAALRRELTEELGIAARIGPEIARYQYQYPGKNPILLVFYRVTDFQGEPRNRVFEAIRWEEPARLPTVDFLEGDVEFVKTLAAGDLLAWNRMKESAWNFEQQPWEESPDETSVNLRAYFDRMPDEKLQLYRPDWSDDEVITWAGDFRDDGVLMLICSERDVEIGEYRRVLAQNIRYRDSVRSFAQ